MSEQPLWVPGSGSSGVIRNAGLRSGVYVVPPFTTAGSAGDPSTTAGRLSALLLPVPVAQAFDRIGLWLVANYPAGSLLRLGIYRVRAGTHPGALVVDAGTLDMSAGAPGWKELAIAVTLQPDLYMLVAVPQPGWTLGAGSMIRTQQGSILGITTGADSSTASASIGTALGINGALPDPGPDLGEPTALNQPAIKVRAA